MEQSLESPQGSDCKGLWYQDKDSMGCSSGSGEPWEVCQRGVAGLVLTTECSDWGGMLTLTFGYINNCGDEAHSFESSNEVICFPENL